MTLNQLLGSDLRKAQAFYDKPHITAIEADLWSIYRKAIDQDVKINDILLELLGEYAASYILILRRELTKPIYKKLFINQFTKEVLL